MSNTKINDGGFAFPLHLPAITGEPDTYWNGMSLRDYFEGHALAGLCANSELFKNFARMRPEMLKVMNVEDCDSFEHKVISMCAKSIADAMIAARNS